MGRYITADHPEAEELFDRLVGYSMCNTLYEEEYDFAKDFGMQIQLRRDPIELINCKGYLKYKEMFFDGWSDIAIEDIIQHGRVLDIPSSIFAIPYEKVKVSYYAGLLVIPEEVKDAVTEISDMLHKGICAWNLPLSHRTLHVIDKFRKQERG